MPLTVATCAALAATLANPAGGADVLLTENCGPLLVRHVYAKPVRVTAAAGVTITALTVNRGGNITFRGGRYVSSGGEEATGPAGYAVNLIAARDVAIDGATFASFNRAIVGSNAVRVAVRYSRFEMGQDGIIAAGGGDWEVTGNTFVQVTFRPSTCTVAGAVVATGTSKRTCEARGGVWRDGWHQDGVQLWGGLQNAVIVGNVMRGVQQGAVDFGTKAWAGRQTVGALVAGNDVQVTGHHSINFSDSVAPVVKHNHGSSSLSARAAPIRAAAGEACGNVGPAGTVGAGAC